MRLLIALFMLYCTTLTGVAQANPFVTDIENKDSQVARKQREMAVFSKKLQAAMGITDKQRALAEKHNLRWKLDGYSLRVEHFCHFEGSNGWVDGFNLCRAFNWIHWKLVYQKRRHHQSCYS
tara:strand:- start:3659 stop:4024 length:366 start_codon:yes stop_codon:yes gene_type:complete